MIAPEDDDPITINLTGGTVASPDIFAPSTTGEDFPIVMISNVNLIGQGEDVTIIDAEGTGGVLIMTYLTNNIISNLSITGGISNGGGGIDLYRSSPILNYVTISNNTAENSGGGIRGFDSHPTMKNVRITNNMATSGGGAYITGSETNEVIPLRLTNVEITHNTAIGSDYGTGGGLNIYMSHVIMTNVTIANNMAKTSGGGLDISYGGNYSYTILLHNVNIVNNAVLHGNDNPNQAASGGGGVSLSEFPLVEEIYTIPILTNVTIANNTNTASNGGGMFLRGIARLINTIIWDNGSESIYHDNNYIHLGVPLITYSNIEAGSEFGGGSCPPGECYVSTQGGQCVPCGEGNIDEDPLFIDPDNGDYTLQENSPCIDTGDPNLWHNDLDGTRSDMGITGGPFVLPNFTSHDFGEVGDIGSSKEFTLYNFRETPITINNVTFGTESFTTDASFPMRIEAHETGVISIDANNTSLGQVEDAMFILSNDLISFPNRLFISLTIVGSEGQILNGTLSGTYPVDTYRITGDLSIMDGDTAYIHAGTEFLFDGQYNFTIYGTLKAIGTESDSIIFDNFGEEKWRGFSLDNASDETIFEYVRISGGAKGEGGGMHLTSSNPTLTHVAIINNSIEIASGNLWDTGTAAGMMLINSNPVLTHVIIANNHGGLENGGGMLLNNSNPILTHVRIVNNTTDKENLPSFIGYVCGMCIINSDPILTHVTITNNSLDGMYLNNSNPVLTHLTITNNTGPGIRLVADGWGWGPFPVSNPQITNTIIWGNSEESILITNFNNDTEDSHDPTISYSNIEGSWEGEGNIDMDPLFTDPDNGDYTLQEGSPCINTGTTDIDGDAADDITDYFGEAPDMGAYEFCAYFDECGVCGGDNSCFDCLGTLNGDALEDECGVCNGDSSTCLDCLGTPNGDAICLNIANIDSDAGTLDVLYSSNSDIAGFQFEIDGIEIIGATSTLGDVTTQSGSSLILGLSISGDEATNIVLPAGSGVLASISFNPNSLESTSCLSDVIIAFEGGVAAPSIVYPEECSTISGCSNVDDCGVCGGDGSSCMMAGDINLDGSTNVLDIIMLMDFILGNQAPNEVQSAQADMNGDSFLNVLDVVMIVDIILGNVLARGSVAEAATFYYGNDLVRYTSDGNIAGVQFSVLGEYEITDSFLPDGWELTSSETTILLFSMDGSPLEDDKLFSYEGNLRLESIIVADWHGSEVVSSSVLIPKEFALSPAYPNPFNPTTTLSFALPVSNTVVISIYNLQGREVATLLNTTMEAGYHSVTWDANSFSSGVYFVHMIAGEYLKTQKLMLLK
jgi:hypothetical protein